MEKSGECFLYDKTCLEGPTESGVKYYLAAALDKPTALEDMCTHKSEFNINLAKVDTCKTKKTENDC